MLLLGVFAWAPATYPGYWEGLEGFSPVFNITSNGAVADIGQTPDIWRGSGRGTYLLAKPLVALGLSPTGAVRYSFIAAFIMGGLGTYSWLCSRLGDRSAGLAGLIYMLMPTFLATVYIRGSLSDALVMGLLPTIMAGLGAFVTDHNPSAMGVAVLGQLWLWRIQPGLAIFVALFALLFVLLVEQDLMTGLAVLVTTAAGVVSLVPYWTLRADSPIVFQEHFVHLFQLLDNEWQVRPSVPGWQDEYPFQLGIVAWSFALFVLWLWGRQHAQMARRQRLFTFLLLSTLLFSLPSLQFSSPLWRWTHADRVLTYPWQMLLVASLPLAALAGSLPALLISLRTTVYWSGLMTLVLLGSHPYLTTNFTQFEPDVRPVATFGPDQELMLLNAEVGGSGDDNKVQLTTAWQVLQPLDFDYNIFFQAVKESDGTLDVVAQVDAQPVSGTHSATSWAVGEIITDTYTLEISADVDTSDLQYYFGFYNWNSGERLPVVEILTGVRGDKLVLYGP